MITNKAQKILSIIIFFAAVPLFAADSAAGAGKYDKLSNMAREYLTETSQPNLVTNIDAVSSGEGILPGEPSALATYLGSLKWYLTSEERYLNGAWQVQFFGRMISIKLGFIRGAFNSLADTYKTTPIAMLSDVTDVYYGSSKDYPYTLVGSAGCFQTPSGPFHFKFAADKLTVSACVNGQPDSSAFSKTITYQQWMDAWTKNAAKYCGGAVKDYCFIPQVTYKSDRIYRLGLLVDKGVPLSVPGGLAADSVELCKDDGASFICARTADSPPLNIFFNYDTQSQYLAWDIYSNTKGKLAAEGQVWETIGESGVFGNGGMIPAVRPAR